MKSSNKHILIVLDAGGCAALSMHTATELATMMKAGVKALYVEDINLLNAVDLPFTREVSLHTAAVSSIDSASMLEKIHIDAEVIKKQIEDIAVTYSVSFSFSSMRGHKTQVFKNRAEEVNMVLIPAASSGRGRQQTYHSKHEVVVVYEEQLVSSDNALNIALSQAAKKNYRLHVIADSEQAQQHVEKMFDRYSGDAVSRLADFSNPVEMISLLYRYAPALFVLPESSSLVRDERVLQKLIDTLKSDILLVQ